MSAVKSYFVRCSVSLCLLLAGCASVLLVGCASVFLVGCASVLLVGCASVMSGPSQDIMINSDVEATEVYIEEDYVGTTPISVTLNRQSGQTLYFRKAGYRAAKLPLKTNINPDFYWNLPFTVAGTTGMSTDYGTGAMYRFTNSTVQVRLKTLSAPSTDTQDAFDLLEWTAFDQLQKEKARHQTGIWTETLNQRLTTVKIRH